MDNGNVGPGNMNARNFERSMAEAPHFDPERLPTPEDKEKDPGNAAEMGQDNMNGGVYLDPSMLGASTVNAIQYEDQANPGIGEIVTETEAGMKSLSDEQVLGTDIDVSKFQKNGVSKEMEQRLDEIKKEKNLYRQSVDFMVESKKSLSASFADRGYLRGGNN